MKICVRNPQARFRILIPLVFYGLKFSSIRSISTSIRITIQHLIPAVLIEVRMLSNQKNKDENHREHYSHYPLKQNKK